MLKENIKKIIPKTILEQEITMKYNILFHRLKRVTKEERKRGRILFLFATPTHSNLGDQAISIAEISYLKKELSQFKVFEITFDEYLRWKDRLNSVIKNQDVLCYHGGGNMGTQYFECEEIFRDIIERFPENKIVTFPQTIYYDDSKFSMYEFEKSKQIYSLHKNLTLTAREEKSYEIMKKAYGENNNVILSPDIVLYLKQKEKINSEGALICLRNDVERSLTEKQHEIIMKKLSQKFDKIVMTDTVLDCEYIGKESRDKIVGDIIEQFGQAQIVITDRLHGMVFSYLAGTPCVVLNNYNYKVKGVYKWIKENQSIRLLDDLYDIDEAIEQVMSAEMTYCCNQSLFNPLKEAIYGEESHEKN